MKRSLFSLMLIGLLMGCSQLLSAQTAKCTAAQKAACAKICATKTACTPAQKAACQQVCAKGKSTATAQTVGYEATEKSVASKTNARPSCTAKKTCQKTAQKATALDVASMIESKQE